MLGYTEVIYTIEEPATTEPMEIVASKMGITLRGISPCVEDLKGLEGFAELITLAWSSHRELLSAEIQLVGH